MKNAEGRRGNRCEEIFEYAGRLCYLMHTMRKLVLFLSALTVAFALQARDGDCPKNKAACDKAKAPACAKAKAGTCDKSKAETKACCPAAKKAEAAAKKPVTSPKTTS